MDRAAKSKKLIYQSWHRGTREADLLMGPFAEKILPTASIEFLQAFEAMLHIPDQVLVSWILGYSDKNPAVDNIALKKLKDFAHNKQNGAKELSL